MPDVEPKVWPRQKPRRPGMPDGSVIEDLDFAIEQWSSDDSRLEEIIARIGNVAIARIANEYLEAEVERLASDLSTALASRPRAGGAAASR
jgi:hypothetical protein